MKAAEKLLWHPRSGDIPQATHGSPRPSVKDRGHRNPLRYVLEDGKRVTQERWLIDLDMYGGDCSTSGGDRLAKFATGKAIKPFLEHKLSAVTEPIKFRTPGQLAYGYDATILADICEAVLKARQEGLLQKQQEHIAKRCEILIRGFARVGIIALVVGSRATTRNTERMKRCSPKS